jgi:restriction system protein
VRQRNAAARFARSSLGLSPPSRTQLVELGEPTTARCPHCGGTMMARAGRQGPFLGCTLFPACKGTRPIR